MSRATLMYHDVVAPGLDDASGFPGPAAAHYKLDTDVFASHLAALAGSGLRFGSVVSPADERDCLLTFDDGGASAVAISNLLDGHAMTGHFFITTARIGQTGFVSAGDVRELNRLGHVVGSHSATHPAEISLLDAAALDAEWRQSTDTLAQLLGRPVTVASIPGGFYSERVVRAAAENGICYLFTSEPTVHTHCIDGCLVLGRYALWRGMQSDHALALARGTSLARQRQWLAWNLKKPLKRWARPVYRSIRQRWLADS